MRFPDCHTYYFEQRSDDWERGRSGLLTASKFGMWLVNNDKRSRKARENAICQLVARMANAWELPSYESKEMERGTSWETDACAAFEAGTGKVIEHVGFCRSKHGLFGCSPDGLIAGENVGFEGKVPLPSTHIKYRRAGTLPDEYRLQVHGSMAVTGAEAWWFQSFGTCSGIRDEISVEGPRLAPFRLLVERDDFTEELHEALKAFSLELEIALKEESEAWNQEFGKDAA